MDDQPRERERALTELYRKLSPADKWLLVGEFYKTAREVHAQIVRHRNPSATEKDIVDDWMELTLEPELLKKVRAHMAERAAKSEPIADTPIVVREDS
jgi:hypothetical protein